MLYWILGALGAVAVLALGISFLCYLKAFYMPPRKPKPEGQMDFPEGEIYVPFYDSMRKWAAETRAMPQQRFSIQSFDGLTLYGSYFEYAPGAPIELMFHGYRGSAERDLSGGVQRCFKLQRSCFLVDQRCSGDSGGRTITFGIREHKDCVAWAEFLVEHFGPEVKIILTGVSMGAATVLMAAGKPLPANVLGVLADCSYSTPREIIEQVIRDMGLPPKLAYPFVKLGARLYGGFDLEETSPLEAMKTCTVPVIFFHGEDDAYVPCEMSRRIHAACPTRKQLVTIPGAGHGLSYPVGKENYLIPARDFFAPEGAYQK
jgi:pimeloyl-ACP methyl ester carboxylesterase